MSWPATIAFSTAGTTLSPKPMMPGRIPRPVARRSRRLARSSSLTVRLVQPAARSSAIVAGSFAGSRDGEVTGAERTTRFGGPSNVARAVAVRVGTAVVPGWRCGHDGDAAQPDLAVAEHHGAATRQRDVDEEVDGGDAARPALDDPGLLAAEGDPDDAATGRLGARREEPAEASRGDRRGLGRDLDAREADPAADRVPLLRARGPLVRGPLRAVEVVLDQERRRRAQRGWMGEPPADDRGRRRAAARRRAARRTRRRAAAR